MNEPHVVKVDDSYYKRSTQGFADGTVVSEWIHIPEGSDLHLALTCTEVPCLDELPVLSEG